jgi:GNAT superfamily N-acetyltransferase
VAGLFNVTYPDSFWTRIGRAAVYFDRYCSGPDMCLIATARGRAVGVTFGSAFARDSPVGLGRSRQLGLARVVLVAAIQRPLVLGLVARRIRGAGARTRGWRSLVVPALAAAEGEAIVGSDVCVVHVFVGPESQGRGVGSALLHAIFRVMGEVGYRWCVAHTTAGSDPVHHLNERVGLHRLLETGDDVVWARRLEPGPVATG